MPINIHYFENTRLYLPVDELPNPHETTHILYTVNEVQNMSNTEAAYDMVVEQMDEELDEKTRIIHNYERIMRERANARRGLIPKKEHPGYIVLQKMQYRYAYTIDEWSPGIDPQYFQKPEERSRAIREGHLHIIRNSVSVWKTTVQTPFSAGLQMTDMESEIIKDLMTSGVMERMGVVEVIEVQKKGSYREYTDESGNAICVLFDWAFKTDFRTGVWLIDIYTTHELIIPPEIRLQEVEKKK